MKKNQFLLGAAALLALGLTACSNEMPVANDNGVAKEAETRYMRVSISNAPNTRAAEFQTGTAAENKAANIMLKFYDASGNPVEGLTYVTVDKDTDGKDIPLTAGWSDPAAGNVGSLKTAVLELSIPRGASYPVYVMCYINPVDYAADGMSTSSMYELRNQKRENFLDDNNNFAMTNSAYYGSNAYTGQSQVKISATPILSTQLYTTASEATAATTPVNIYVERYAAKVNFTYDPTGNKDQTVGDYTLTFEPKMWTVNADAHEMYVVKRFSDSDKDTEAIPTYQAVQNTLGSWTTWNDATNFRSYWACSPGFYATEFPQVSDDIIDKAAADQGTGAGELVGKYELRYYSYNQITDANLKSEGLGKEVVNGTTTKYVLENTMGEAAFNCANPKAAAPSVLVVGEYAVKKGETEISHEDGFCIYNNDLYWRDEIPEGDDDGMTIMDAMLNANSILFISEEVKENTVLNANNAGDLANLFEVVHPSKAVRALQGNPTPHRYVTLQLKTGENVDYTGLYYRPMGTDQRRPVTAAVVNQINLQLWGQIGIARAYTENKGYFSIPIQHLGFTEGGEQPITDGAIDWRNKVSVGDFGLVRNHVYDIQVSAIEGLASGIENLENPLVPSMEDNLRNVKFNINILNWRIVPAQENIVLK